MGKREGAPCACLHDGISVAEEPMRKQVPAQDPCSRADSDMTGRRSPALQIIPHVGDS